MVKIALINKTDLNGGAAVSTYRLMKALRKFGADAKMLVVDKTCDDDNVVAYSRHWHDRYVFLAERLHIFLNNKFSRSEVFKVDTALWGRDIASHPIVQEADVIMLNWVNQGALSIDAVRHIAALGKPVIWTMHDMWNCTGICHHAYECEAFKNACGQCMYLKSNNISDLSHRIWKAKKELYDTTDIAFVAVSHWLEGKCRESSLMKNMRVSVIPNTPDIDAFSTVRQSNADYSIDADAKVLVMAAARLDDDVKGFPLLIESLEKFRENYPEQAAKSHLLLAGGIRNVDLLKQIAIPYTYLGRVDTDTMKAVFSHADIILSTSLYETLPGTLIEGSAAGCVPVTFGNGGQADIVDHMKTGYIAQYKSPTDFAKGINWAMNISLSREMLHEEMKRRFSEETVVRKYLDLINTLIHTND